MHKTAPRTGPARAGESRTQKRCGAGVVERVRSAPDGVARHHHGADVDGDGDVDGDDNLGISRTIDQAGYIAEYDLNRDGANDGKDGKIVSESQVIAQIAGRISVVDSPVGYDGAQAGSTPAERAQTKSDQFG